MSIIRVGLIGYATVLVALVVMETRLVYPGAYMNEPFQVEGSGPTVDIEYQTEDGVALRGQLLERPGHQNALLFLHGNATKAKWSDDVTRRLSDAFDATVMVAEYRGFDGSGPSPNEAGVIADSIAAMNCLCDREGIDPAEVIVYGRSLGGACAVAVAADRGAKALVLDRTFDRITDVASGKFPFVPIRLLMRNRFDSIARIGQFEGPLVQLHGTSDEVIPIAHGAKLFAAAKAPKRWLEVPGMRHNDRLPSIELRRIVDSVAELTSVAD